MIASIWYNVRLRLLVFFSFHLTFFSTARNGCQEREVMMMSNFVTRSIKITPTRNGARPLDQFYRYSIATLEKPPVLVPAGASNP
jgi:hypothetical protein